MAEQAEVASGESLADQGKGLGATLIIIASIGNAAIPKCNLCRRNQI